MGGGYETGSGSYPVTNFSITEPPVSESSHDAHSKEWRVITEMLNHQNIMFLGIIHRLVLI
jgi:hypothetical protein